MHTSTVCSTWSAVRAVTPRSKPASSSPSHAGSLGGSAAAGEQSAHVSWCMPATLPCRSSSQLGLSIAVWPRRQPRRSASRPGSAAHLRRACGGERGGCGGARSVCGRRSLECQPAAARQLRGHAAQAGGLGPARARAEMHRQECGAAFQLLCLPARGFRGLCPGRRVASRRTWRDRDVAWCGRGSDTKCGRTKPTTSATAHQTQTTCSDGSRPHPGTVIAQPLVCACLSHMHALLAWTLLASTAAAFGFVPSIARLCTPDRPTPTPGIRSLPFLTPY
eukprot:40217-Chlamydomonas_euryale.AAC.3